MNHLQTAHRLTVSLLLALSLSACAEDDFLNEGEDSFGAEDDEFRAGTACEVVALHQYFSPGALDHLYTGDWESMNRAAGSVGYAWQGIEGYACANQAPGTTPLYEYVRSTGWPHPSDTNHYYSVTYHGQTIDADVEDYHYVGIVAYVYSSNGGDRRALDQYYSHNIAGTDKRDHFYTTNENPALDPSWGYGAPTVQGYLRMDQGAQEVPIGHDYNRPLNFFTRPFSFKLWYESNASYTVWERCVDQDSPDYNVDYRHEVRQFDDGELNLTLAVGDECYLRHVGVHAGQWFTRIVTYEAPVHFSY